MYYIYIYVYSVCLTYRTCTTCCCSRLYVHANSCLTWCVNDGEGEVGCTCGTSGGVAANARCWLKPVRVACLQRTSIILPNHANLRLLLMYYICIAGTAIANNSRPHSFAHHRAANHYYCRLGASLSCRLGAWSCCTTKMSALVLGRGPTAAAGCRPGDRRPPLLNLLENPGSGSPLPDKYVPPHHLPNTSLGRAPPCRVDMTI